MRRFPEEIKGFGWNSTWKQKWNTTIQESGSGKYRAMTNQLYPNWIITETIGWMSDKEANALMGFVALTKGAFEPFLWKDYTNHHMTKQTLPRLSSGKYQCTVQTGSYVEPAQYVENVVVYKNGTKVTTGYTVSDGIIIFSTAPASTDKITADYDFLWKVRFADDGMGVTRIFKDIDKSSSFKLEVVR